jgi:maleate isomerase
MYGYRARIGYTSPPAATEVFPYEFYRIVPRGVTLVVNTLPLVERTADEVDRAYEVSLRAAKVMAQAGIDLMVFGGLPINISQGWNNVENLIRETEKEIGVPVVTSVTCQAKAMGKLGSRHVGIVHPYDASHDARHMEYIREFGLQPTGAVGAGYKFHQLGQIPVGTALKLGHELKQRHTDTDTIYFACPHWAIIDAIDPLEQALGVNVMTALQAIAWESMRRCNVLEPIQGYGRLLREF